MKISVCNASYFLLVLILLSGCQPTKDPAELVGQDYISFQIKRGTNIAHWLSQSSRRGDERTNFFTKKDIAFIDSIGFDHIRLPMDEEQLWDEDGNRNADAFQLLKQCMEWCDEYGLRVVIDLHILRSHHFNAKEKPLWTVPAEQDKFISLWKDLSSFLTNWPNGMAAYEFMNEPVADDPEQWNVLLARVADSIRHWEPARVLVIGSNRWQSASTFDQLKIPANDPNILLSFHFYEPFFLSHYQASWTDLKDFKGDVNYPGQIVLNSNTPEHKRIYNRDTLMYMMRKPLRLADSLNLPLYCGEFGMIDKSPIGPKLAWYQDMISIFDEKGIGYANWNYKAGSFGIVDKDIKPDLPVINILVNSNNKK
jgi:endoglucanase